MAAAHTIVFVHSPFLGPASLRPLAERVRAGGMPVLVPDLRAAVTGEPVHSRLLAEFATAITTAGSVGPLVLVGHSGAGPLLPGLAEAGEPTVAALLFLDAGLPTPGQSWQDTAPPELVRDLRSRAHGPLLPPWHRWFGGDPLAALVPDVVLREELVADEPEVPVAFLTEPRPAAEWTGPAGYLQLSPPYARPARRAEQKGWPTRRVDADHLSPATRPEPVADELLDVLATVTAGWSANPEVPEG